MKKSLLKLNVGLCEILYVTSLLILGYWLKDYYDRYNSFMEHSRKFLLFKDARGILLLFALPVGYRIMLKFAKDLTPDNFSVGAQCAMAVVPLVPVINYIISVVRWFSGSQSGSALFSFINLAATLIIVVNYFVCAGITHKEFKEKHKI